MDSVFHVQCQTRRFRPMVASLNTRPGLVKGLTLHDPRSEPHQGGVRVRGQDQQPLREAGDEGVADRHLPCSGLRRVMSFVHRYMSPDFVAHSHIVRLQNPQIVRLLLTVQDERSAAEISPSSSRRSRHETLFIEAERLVSSSRPFFSHSVLPYIDNKPCETSRSVSVSAEKRLCFSREVSASVSSLYAAHSDTVPVHKRDRNVGARF